MTDDGALLQRYLDKGDEPAFADVVAWHVHLVYFAALRHVGGDAHLARDVTQAVFIELAHRARQLAQHRSLAGWLYLAARNLGAKAVRSEVRRRRREAEAEAMRVNDTEGSLKWNDVAPVLDRALSELSPKDREAVLLRHWEHRAFGEIARIQETSEGAVRMRVTRSLERLRAGLLRAGIPSTAAAIELVMSTQAMASCPPGLAAHVTSSALATAAAHSTGGAFVLFVSATTTKIIGAAVVAAALLALWTTDARTTQRLESQIAREQRTVDSLRQLAAQRTVHVSQEMAFQTPAPAPARRKAYDANPRLHLGPLPDASARNTVTILADGTPLWNGEPVTLQEYIDDLVAYRQAHPEPEAQLAVNANAAAPAQMAYLFDQARKAGFTNVWFDPQTKGVRLQNLTFSQDWDPASRRDQLDRASPVHANALP